MGPVSDLPSVIAILQLTSSVIRYLNDVKDASKERAQFAIEASNLYNLLVQLKFRLEELPSNEPWYSYTMVRELDFENGFLDQYRHALERLDAKMKDKSRLKNLGNALMWTSIKEDVASILTRIERLKRLVTIALKMNYS